MEPVTPESGPSKTKRWLIGGGVGLLLLAVVGGSIVSASRGGKGSKIYAEEAKRRDISRIVKASGQVDPRTKVNISAHVIGKIQRLYVQEGDWIDKGKPFLDLERDAFVAVRDSTKAQLEIQRSSLAQAPRAARCADQEGSRAAADRREDLHQGTDGERGAQLQLGGPVARAGTARGEPAHRRPREGEQRPPEDHDLRAALRSRDHAQ